MSVFEALAREMDATDFDGRRLLQIRVCPDALPGSPVALPVTPERARVMRMVITPEGAVGPPEGFQELLVHPADWMDLVGEMRWFDHSCEIDLDEFQGVRVVKS